MSTTAYETSITELCKRLDALALGVSDEFTRHQARLQTLQQMCRASDNATEVRGAVLASAYALLEAVEGLQSQVGEVRTIIEHQQGLLNSLHEESRTDALTGHLNRRAFDEEIARRVAESRRTGSPVGLIFADIDHFKVINDTYGHTAGDKVIKGVANVLANSLRDMDIVSRYGGEEFAMLLPNTNLVNTCRVAERSRIAVSQSVFGFDDRELSVTISAGVTLVGDAPLDALRHVDDALYAAKQAGRNRVFAFKDGYCQPLHQEPTGEHGAQRRRWMRFLSDEMRVKLRSEDGPWHVADVKDESLTGIGLIVPQQLSLPLGSILQIDYCDDMRNAEVMFIKNDPHAGTTRLGLRWCDTSF